MRRVGLKLHRLCGYGMRESKPESVKCLACHTRPFDTSVGLIANKRIPKMGHVNTNLVCSSRVESAANEAVSITGAEQVDRGSRLLSRMLF